MSKRFYYDEFCEEIFDEEIQTYPSNQSICGILNKQADRISELEEQLKNAIVPKFKVGQTIWYIYGKNIKSFTISKIEIEIRINPLIAYSSPYIYQYEENCFATKEEAQVKLEEVKTDKSV